MRKFLAVVLVLSLLAGLAIWQRHRIIVPLATSGAPIPPDRSAPTVPGGVAHGTDGHFWVTALDERTYAIAEPFSWARNVNYLVLGERRALLFDAGVGHFDIRPVVESITALPVTFMPSHFHYDHTGQGDWAHRALVDLPHLRARAQDDVLEPTWGEHLGTGEAIERPTWHISEWIKPGSVIDLGGRTLTLIYTPGHTDNSVSLYDRAADLMLTGDFLTSSGMLSSFLPTARLGDYLQSAEKVLKGTTTAVTFRGAHAAITNETPESRRQDVAALRDGLLGIKEGSLRGEGVYPVVYRISATTALSTETGFLQNWTPTYPDEHAVHRFR